MSESYNAFFRTNNNEPLIKGVGLSLDFGVWIESECEKKMTVQISCSVKKAENQRL